MSDSDLLTLVQWLSPAFPLGSFAYSHGLETAIAQGDVADAEGLAAWVRTVLDQGSGRIDAALLLAALTGDARLWPDLAAEARALAASAERWTETEALGRAFADTVSALGPIAIPALPLPVAVGAAASHLDLAPERVAALYLQAFAANLVSCAVRSVPLGQTEGQRVVADLAPLCLQIARDASDTPRDRIGTAAFGADLAAMRHETQDVRLYRS